MRSVLFVNSVQKQCGCHSYGTRSFNILQKSKKYKFIYCEPEDNAEFESFLRQFDPSAVIYNYHPLTMSWMQRCTAYPLVKHLALWHEGTPHHHLSPDKWLYVEELPRPLIEGFKSDGVSMKFPVITSFGFGFGSKGFGRVVKMFNDQFDYGIIRLHIPRAYYGDRNGEATAGVVPGCMAENYKPGISIEWSHYFMADEELLQYLSQSSVNAFFYDDMHGRGISSVIDYALSANVPIAINDSAMFRHIQTPEINVANKSLQEIIDQGSGPLQKYRELWSNENFLAKYEEILDNTL